jgi:hypothetical protein
MWKRHIHSLRAIRRKWEVLCLQCKPSRRPLVTTTHGLPSVGEFINTTKTTSYFLPQFNKLQEPIIPSSIPLCSILTAYTNRIWIFPCSQHFLLPRTPSITSLRNRGTEKRPQREPVNSINAAYLLTVTPPRNPRQNISLISIEWL